MAKDGKAVQMTDDEINMMFETLNKVDGDVEGIAMPIMGLMLAAVRKLDS